MKIPNLVVFVALYLMQNGKGDVIFEISNREPAPIWIGIQGNSGQPHLRNGGFSLDQAQTVEVSAPDNWAGKIWPRTHCDLQSKRCKTGDCGDRLECDGAGARSPVTQIEITLSGYGDLDYYDLSLSDGFNLRAFIEPVHGQRDCKKAKCLADINVNCPNALRLDHAGTTIGCHSACSKFDTDAYCCRGAHNRPETCQRKDWPKDYPAFFQIACPDAYSYAYDDHKSTFTCKANRYRIHFGNSY